MLIQGKQSRIRRHRRVRAKVSGTAECPRLAVYRSLKHISVQLIDDETSKTLVSVSDNELKSTTKASSRQIAQGVGKLTAKRAKELGITRVVFDRGGYAYHGRVQAIAEGAREGGLEF